MITLGIKRFYRHYTQSSFQTDVDYVYGSDYTFSHERRVFISSGDGTYYLNFTVRHKVNTQVSLSSIWRIVRTSGANQVFVWAWKPAEQKFDWELHPDQSGYQSTTINLLNIFGFEFINSFQEEVASGTWEILEQIYEGEPDPVPSFSLAGEFDLRYLVLRELRPLRDKVDTESRFNRCELRGEWRTLPVATDLYPNGWNPTTALDWTLELKETALNDLKVVTGTTAVSPRDATTGKIADFSYDWDCKDDSGEFKYGVAFPVASAEAGAPTAGQVISKPVNTRVLCTRCSCLDGLLRLIMMLAEIAGEAGPPLQAPLAYTGMYANDVPASMGYGWRSATGIRVFEDPSNDDLIYEDEYGGSMRWELVSSDYVATHPDNYAEIVKEPSNPNYRYAVTFKDQTRREFGADGLLLRDIDRNGNVVTYDRTSGNLVVSDGKGRALYYDYGLTPRADGQIQTIRVNDPVNGRLTTLSYYPDTDPDHPDRLFQITDAAGETTTFYYTEEGQVQAILDARNLPMAQYTYDALSRKVLEQNYDQTQTQWNYGDQTPLFSGSPVLVDAVLTIQYDLTTNSSDPAWYRESWVFYDSFFNPVENWTLVDRMVSPSVYNVSFSEFNDPNNPFLMTRQISPNGATTEMTYNAQGNLSTVTDDHLNVTTYEYAEDIDPTPLNPKHRSLLRKIHRPEVTVNGVLTQYPPTQMEYDPNGNLVRIIDAQNEDVVLTRRSDGVVTQIKDRRGFLTVFGYNSRDNLTSITTPAGPGAAPDRTTTLSYDDYDNVEAVEDPLNHRVESIFDNNDRPLEIMDARGKTIEMNYTQGLLRWVEAPANQGSGINRRKSRFYYDNSARVVQVDAQVGPDDVNDLLPRVGYEYTGFSQLRGLFRLMDSNVKNTFHQYDPQGRMLESDDFLGRTTQVFHEPFCVGNTVVTPRGVQRSSSFDSLCRLAQVETQEEIHVFEYDELDRPILARVGERYAHQPEPNRVGGRYSDSIYRHDTRYVYDSLDRVTEVIYPNGQTVSYTYDAEGNVLSMTDVHGKVTSYTYYNDGRLFTVTFEGKTFTYNYDLAGRLETVVYPSGSNLVASFTKPDNSSGWDENGQLLCLRYLKNGNHFHRFEYTYDDSGNRISMVDTPENPSLAVEWSYGYDWINRLESVSRGGQVTSLYAYDESDNRIGLSLPQADEVWSYDYDLADQIVSRSRSLSGGPETLIEGFGHDDDGNMKSRTQGGILTEYLWNTHNRLRQVKVDGQVVDSTSYDHGGIRRLRKDGAGKTKSYSSGSLSLCDTRPTGPIAFIQGHQLLGLEESGNCYYFITDGLSSVRVVVDASCNAQGEFRYDEFGQLESSSQPAAVRAGHAYVGGLGQRNEMAGLGLYYARQRWYDASLGRWLSQDPIGFDGGLNVYGYTTQDPINGADPSGLIPQTQADECRDRPIGEVSSGVMDAAILAGSLALGALALASGVGEAAALGAGIYRAYQGFQALGRGRALLLAGAGYSPQISNFLNGIVQMATGAAGGGGMGVPRFSPQKQGRHVMGHRSYRGGSYFTCMKQAEEVFEAFVAGRVQILGSSRGGNIHFRYQGATGFNHNPTSGFPNQPTDVFFIKGTNSASIVPTNPNWGP